MPCLRQSRRRQTPLALKAHCAFNPKQARRSELLSRATLYARKQVVALPSNKKGASSPKA
ncbi:hypothetical protein ABZU00_05140 [Gardnerella swidsinskii]